MLLADFHIHTNWSDGRLAIDEVDEVDGRRAPSLRLVSRHFISSHFVSDHGFPSPDEHGSCRPLVLGVQPNAADQRRKASFE